MILTTTRLTRARMTELINNLPDKSESTADVVAFLFVKTPDGYVLTAPRELSSMDILSVVNGRPPAQP